MLLLASKYKLEIDLHIDESIIEPGAGIKVLLETMGAKIFSEVKTVLPAMGGHLVWLTNGLYNIEEHGKFLENSEKLEVNLIAVYYDENTSWDAEDFFDILFNSWDLTNVYSALMEGKENCLNNKLNLTYYY